MYAPAERPVDMEFDDLESGQPQKRNLMTEGGVAAEWKFGSKRRVIKYYAISMLIGAVIGGIVGAVIGVIVRFA